MSDESVRAALRSDKRLVLIEAPAGCGKTYQGSDYAREMATQVGRGAVLVLTHTHAACDVFAARTRDIGRIDIRTIDSLICQIAGAYHLALGIPSDTAAWARSRGNNGYRELGDKVARLLELAPYIADGLARRYPIVVCDEHQDSAAGQHSVAMALYHAGASLRVFGDTMQRIYHKGEKGNVTEHWLGLKEMAGAFEKLDTPHRWSNGARPLGEWLLQAREVLSSGGRLDMRRGLPPGVQLVIAENQALNHGGYRLAQSERRPIDNIVKSATPLLILSAQNRTVDALRPCFARSIPIWEGHTREVLATLVAGLEVAHGDASAVASAMVKFMEAVATGFTRTEYSSVFCGEVAGRCASKRSGKPGRLQELARLILDQPDHKGIGKVLRRLGELIQNDSAFARIRIDRTREFHDAISLGDFASPDAGFTEVARRRTYARPSPPARAISTIHKAKGLECDHVVVIPCDANHFRDLDAARCLLYVAMSRARRSLTLVASRQNPSPLILA